MPLREEPDESLTLLSASFLLAVTRGSLAVGSLEEPDYPDQGIAGLHVE
jgi:hypothetical protein